MDIATLGLEIRSDGVVVAKDRLKDFERQSGRTERAADSLSSTFRFLAPAIAAVTTALGIRALVQYADTWSDMQSRVGAAIKDMQAAPALMQRMVDLANASYSPLEQTVEVYARNVGVLRDLGIAADGAADFTEALNHALVITATRGQRATSVQDALSKAMAVGRLQADGLETVLANGGRVAEALADELGTTVSGLRAFASQGKITGSVIADALLNRLEDLRAEAGEMPATMADAFVRIQTNLTAVVGRMDQATGASGEFAMTLIGLADAIDDNADNLVRTAVVIQTMLNGAIEGVTGLFSQMGLEFDGAMTLIIAGAGTAGYAVTMLGFTVLRTMAMITGALMANPFALFIGFIAGAVAASYVFRDEIAQLIGFDVYGVFKDLANDIIGLMVGVYQAVVAAWKALPGEFESIGRLAWNALLEGLSGPAIQWTNPFTGEIQDILNIDLTGFKSDLSEAESNAAGLASAAFQAAQGIDYIGQAGQGIRDLWDNALGAQEALAALAGGDAIASGLGGTGKLNAYQEAIKAVNDNISAMQLEMSVLGQSAQAASKMRMEYELMNAAREAGVALTPKVLSDIEMLSTAYAGVEEQLRRMNEIYDLGLGITKGLFSDVTSYIRENMSEWKTWGDVVGGVWAGIGQAASNALTRIADKFIENAAMGIWDMLFGSIFGAIGGSWAKTAGGNFFTPNSFVPGGFYPGIPGFANGTPYAPGGLAWVGERGPELVNLPRGSQVYDHQRSMQVANQSPHNDNVRGGGGDMRVFVSVDGARGDREIEAAVERGVSQGLAAYDERLPGRIRQLRTSMGGRADF